MKVNQGKPLANTVEDQKESIREMRKKLDQQTIQKIKPVNIVYVEVEKEVAIQVKGKTSTSLNLIEAKMRLATVPLKGKRKRNTESDRLQSASCRDIISRMNLVFIKSTNITFMCIMLYLTLFVGLLLSLLLLLLLSPCLSKLKWP